jgi:co-chaperonin GroES (HSP10)
MNINSDRNYIPIGTNLLIALCDPEKSVNSIVLPQGVRPEGPLTADVLAIGDEVTKFKVGQEVVLCHHPRLLVPLNKDKRMVIIDQSDIVAFVV